MTLNVIESTIEFVPVLFQSKGFASKAMEIYNTTNPITASFTALRVIVNVCLPPNVKYPVKCLIFFSQVGLCVYTGGTASVLTFATTVASARQILEEIS